MSFALDIRQELDPVADRHLEGVGQHEELGICIKCRLTPGLAEPGAPDYRATVARADRAF
jgi:hypothetical protein